ncbi:MAG: PAS domain S-box protein [Bryobacteraceae bacterium]
MSTAGDASILTDVWNLGPTMIWVSDRTRGCVQFNASWLSFRGRTLEQESDYGWADGVHPDDLAECVETYTRCFDLREPFQIEYRLQRHDGQYRWVTDHGMPRFSREGDFLGYIGVCFDINESRIAQQALEESENRYRSVITAMAEGVLVVDQGGVISACNPAAETMLDLPRDHVVGQSILRAFPHTITEKGEPCEPAGCPMEATRRTGQPQRNVVFGLKHHDRRTVWISVNTQSLEPDFPGTKPPYSVVATFSDISERKRVQEELAYQALVLSQVNEAVIAFDAAGAVQHWNAGAERLFRCPPRAALGKRIEYVLPLSSRESRKIGLLAAVKQNGYWQWQGPGVRADGSEFWADVSAAAIRGRSGEFVGAVVSVRDVTRLHNAEKSLQRTAEDFKTLFDAGPVPAFIECVEEDRILAVNEAALHAYGYTREEFAVLSLFDIRAPEERPTLEAYLAEYGEWPRSGIWRHRRKSGGIFEVQVTARQVEYLGNKARLCLARDVTAQRRTERALEEARQKAEQANRAKSEFLATMSHEIRTPMNGILGMTRVLLDSPLTGEQRACLETVLSSASNLMQLLNDILDASKIEAGKIELENVEFDLRECLEQAIGLLSQSAREKGIALTLSFGAGTPNRIHGDPTRLRQIVLNFVSNAVKFTEQGYVILAVSAEPTSNNRHLYEISVHDTGIGIAESQIPHLFAPFSQADTSTTRRFGGSGLGLSIARQLASLMGGHVRASSREGEGSTFTALIPLRVSEESAGPSHSVFPPVSATPVLSGLRVLVVEDNPVNQKVACRLLEKQGCQVDLARNGMEAVEMAAGVRYQLVLMDCQMPGMDGFEATRRIRERESAGEHLPIVAMTAYAMKGDRERCLEAGMDDYITKPVQPEALYRIVETWSPGAARKAASGT